MCELLKCPKGRPLPYSRVGEQIVVQSPYGDISVELEEQQIESYISVSSNHENAAKIGGIGEASRTDWDHSKCLLLNSYSIDHSVLYFVNVRNLFMCVGI